MLHNLLIGIELNPESMKIRKQWHQLALAKTQSFHNIHEQKTAREENLPEATHRICMGVNIGHMTCNDLESLTCMT